MQRLFALCMLALWCAGFFWLSIQSWARVFLEFRLHVYWLAILMLLVSICATLMLLKFLKLWLNVARGNISPRLSARVVRNILADGLFFFKTGWKG